MSVCPHAHTFGHFDDHMLACTYALMHTCSYMLGLSHVYMEDRILPYSHLDAHLLDWSHAWMLTSLNAHTLTCFDNHMLSSSHAFLIICYYAACFNDNMLPCPHTLIFTCFISTHMCTHLVGGLSGHAIACSYAQMLWRLCLNVEVIGR